MIGFLREIRLIPVVLFATAALLALKTAGLIMDGRYTLGDLVGMTSDDITGTIPDSQTAETSGPATSATKPRQSWAQEIFGYPEVTGAVDSSKKPEPAQAAPAASAKTAKKPEEPPKGTAGWTPVPIEPGKRVSPAEQAILERLHERRNELDARKRDLEMRESLVRAAEKRLEGRVAELKELESRINTAEQGREQDEALRFKNLITMYENMKAKDAAKIFDRLALKVLVQVATQINPRRMSDILAQMTPEAAERLTVELANRSAKRGPREGRDNLPKIEGRPTPPN
jgi:flagellar motility protein MotE (MotC chaperone)